MKRVNDFKFVARLNDFFELEVSATEYVCDNIRGRYLGIDANFHTKYNEFQLAGTVNLYPGHSELNYILTHTTNKHILAMLSAKVCDALGFPISDFDMLKYEKRA